MLSFRVCNLLIEIVLQEFLLDIEQVNHRVATFDEAVARELKRAEDLVQHGFYTEAALRLGRAMEANIYSAGRELGVELTNKVIPDLENVRKQIQDAQASIMLKKSSEEVRKLANSIKNLAEAMANLSENVSLRDGTVDEERPRPNEQLYREFKQRTNDSNIKRRLGMQEAQIRQVQKIRNQAAHAAIDGTEREISKEEYEALETIIAPVMDTLFALRISERDRIQMSS